MLLKAVLLFALFMKKGKERRMARPRASFIFLRAGLSACGRRRERDGPAAASEPTSGRYRDQSPHIFWPARG